MMVTLVTQKNALGNLPLQPGIEHPPPQIWPAPGCGGMHPGFAGCDNELLPQGFGHIVFEPLVDPFLLSNIGGGLTSG